jgi:hypothetical protein
MINQAKIKKIINFSSQHPVYSGLDLNTVALHHEPVELPEPVVSFFQSEVHQGNTKLGFFMVTVHNLDHQDSMLQKVKPRPNVLNGGGFYRVSERFVDVSVREETFRSDDSVTFLPLLDVL